VIEVDTPAGQQALLRHELDIAVIRLSAPSRALTVQPWRRDHFVIALQKQHPAAADQGRPVDLAQFADEPWVWLHRDASPAYHDELMATCRQAGFTPDLHHRAKSITTQLTMVACGLGVTLVPNVAARSIHPPTVHRPLAKRADLVELALVSRADGHQPLVDEFVRTALDLTAGEQAHPRRPA
jgi:DNA-binding transcriptional LysR family regulator